MAKKKKKKTKKASPGKERRPVKRKAVRKKKKAAVSARTKGTSAKVKLLAGLSLYDFVIDPGHYEISGSPQSVTVTGYAEFRGNDAADVFVVRMDQPQSSLWRLSPTEVRFDVRKVGRKNLSWAVTLTCTGPIVSGDTFQVTCSGFLLSDPTPPLQQTIEFSVV